MHGRSVPLPRSLTYRRLAVVMLACAVAVTVTSCSASKNNSQLPAKNIEQWSMPLDQYQQSDRAAAEYAELLLDRPCMVSAGYSWNVPYENTSTRNPTTNMIDVRLMTSTIVSKWGYHSAIAHLPNEAQWAQFNEMTDHLDPAEFARLRGCQSKARKVIPLVDDQSNYAAALVNGSIDTASRTSKVMAATAAWRKCMVSAGIPDLPSSPQGMPTDSEVQKFALADPSSKPGPNEIAAAEKDVACRTSSGYQEAEYNAEWNAQVVVLNRYRDQLDRNKRILDAAAKKVANEIATHAPSN
jgi:hypothetical protein